MANRSLNQVMLIGNLTRDPELRYTPAGAPVLTFTVATNRRWKTQNGELKDEAQFHRVVSWNKLAELLSQLLLKGTQVFVQGRLQYRKWTGQDGNERQTTEIVASDVIVLSRAKQGANAAMEVEPAEVESKPAVTAEEEAPKPDETVLSTEAGAGGEEALAEEAAAPVKPTGTKTAATAGEKKEEEGKEDNSKKDKEEMPF